LIISSRWSPMPVKKLRLVCFLQLLHKLSICLFPRPPIQEMDDFFVNANTASDPHTTSMILTKLQNPVKNGFEKINDSLKAASSTHKKIGKALDRARELSMSGLACSPRHLTNSAFNSTSLSSHSLLMTPLSPSTCPSSTGRLSCIC